MRGAAILLETGGSVDKFNEFYESILGLWIT